MKSYNYCIGPTSQFYYCGVPFRLDMRPKCDINCIYCFARSRGGRRTNSDQVANAEFLIKKFDHALEGKLEPSDIISEYLIRRMPLHIGGMSDPFSDPLSKDCSKKILEHLQRFQYPIILSTKKPSNLLTNDFFASIKHNRNIIIQVSISTVNPAFQKILEPYAESMQSRLESMRALIDIGVNVSCRAQPVIPGITDCISIIDRVYDTNCKHIIFEFLKLSVEKNLIDYSAIDTILGYSIRKYYSTHNAKLVGREWILPSEYRYNILSEAKRYANGKEIAVSLADYGLYHLGDLNCCCGVDLYQIDSSWNSGCFSNLLTNKQGEIQLHDIETSGFPQKSIARYINSKCRLSKPQMQDYIIDKWNKPGTVNAPDCYLGVRALDKCDAHGNRIYLNESSLWRC